MTIDYGTVAAYFLVFCRVGACVMLMPGYATTHIPVQARLFLALAVSLAIAPLIAMPGAEASALASPVAFAKVVLAEFMAGGLIGLVGRLAMTVVNVAGSVIAQAAGFSGMATTDDGMGETATEIGAMLSLSALTLLMVLDFHVDALKALISSYDVLPMGVLGDSAIALEQVVDTVADAFVLAVRISAPFIAAGIIINFSFGLINKIAPQVPAIFISIPFVMAAGLYILQHLAVELSTTLTQSTLARIGQ